MVEYIGDIGWKGGRVLDGQTVEGGRKIVDDEEFVQ
jgi:hypothetical protein